MHEMRRTNNVSDELDNEEGDVNMDAQNEDEEPVEEISYTSMFPRKFFPCTGDIKSSMVLIEELMFVGVDKNLCALTMEILLLGHPQL